MNEIPIGSESYRKRNPHLFGPVGAVEAEKPKPTPSPALECGPAKRQRRSHRMAIGISLITIRRRLLDDDNNVGSLKPLRDSIARTLNIDDADPRLHWEYAQVLTSGKQGVIVKIETRARQCEVTGKTAPAGREGNRPKSYGFGG